MGMFRAFAVAVAVALLASGSASGDPYPAQRPTAFLLDTATLQAPRLSESSGIIPSRRRPGVFWTHNDSGDGPWLYATDSAGTNLGRVRVIGATATDWEDISAGPCTRSEGHCLFIGDIGDNEARRPSITIYVVPEPDPPAGAPGDTARSATVEDTITLRYPDRPHDAEAMTVVGGWLYVITKDRTTPPVLYRSPTRVSGPRVLAMVGALPISTGLLRGRLVTGAAATPDGKVLVVRTYVSLHFFALADGAPPTPLTDRDGIVIPVIEAQGEGVCVDDHGRLVLTGERSRARHAILARVQVSGLTPP